MHLLNDAVMQALCWTLIHSLWQGLVAAILAGIVILGTKKASSVARYNCLAAIFLLFMATSLFTFTKQLHIAAVQHPVETNNLQHVSNGLVDVFPATGDGIVKSNRFTIWINYLNSHAAVVVAIWLIILSARLVKLMVNVNYVRRVRQSAACNSSRFWQQRVHELADRLQIRATVTLLESAFIKVPMTAGVFKPVIFFPLAMISQIPPEQVEAVLLHELAHIKRKDYFVNMLQRFAEALFFFNPGVLWISSLIRDERESCCDDIAISETKNKQQFLHALVSFQEYNLAESTGLGMAFPGRKNHLLERVNRIITNNNKTLNSMEKIFLAGCFAATALATLAFSSVLKTYSAKQPVSINQAVKVKGEPVEAVPLTGTNTADTLPVRAKKDREYISTNGDETTFYKKGYKIVCAGDKIVELYINDKKIADDKIEDHRQEIEERITQIKGDMHLQTEQLGQQEALVALKQAEMNARMDELKLGQENLTLQALKNLSKKDAEGLSLEQEKLKQQNELLLVLQEKIIADSKSKGLNDSQRTDLLKLKNEQLVLLEKQIQLQKLRRDGAELGELAEEAVPAVPAITFHAAPVNPVLPVPAATPEQSNLLDPIPPVPAVQQDKTITAIINLLLDEKIITSRDNLVFTLNAEVFEVNGVTQSEELHKKLAGKYIHDPKDHIIYSHHGGSTHADVIHN